MMRKSDMFATFDGFEFRIGRSDCGQIVVKLTPAEWEALPEWAQETVVKIDILLAAEWALENTQIRNYEIREGFLCLL